MMKTTTSLRLSCLTKSCLQTLPRQLTFPNLQKGTMFLHLHTGDSIRESINAPSVTSASSITLSSLSIRESTPGYSPTTALSAGGLSEQPPCWPVTGCENAKMLHIFVLSVGTVFQPHWTNSDITAQNGAGATTVGSAERVFQSLAA